MPFGNPFRPAFVMAGVLVETRIACRLDAGQYELVRAIAKICGDMAFCLSVTEFNDAWSPKGRALALRLAAL